MIPKTKDRLLLILGLWCFTLLLIWYWRYGYIHLDGGYYISAGNGVAMGQLPYRDFFFPQGPIYPYIYGLIQYFIGSTVQTTRLISLIFSLFIFILSFKLSYKLGGWIASFITVVILGLNSFISYFLVIEKLNALSGLFFLWGVLFYLDQRSKRSISVSLVFFTLSLTTRYTLLPVLVPVMLWLLWEKRKKPREPLFFVGLVLIVLVIVTLPFLLLCPEQFLYGIIGVHVSASAGSTYHFGLLNKCGAISQLSSYLTLLLFLTVPVVCSQLFPQLRDIVIPSKRERIMWVALGLISLAHFSANWFHASYQIPIVPVWTVLTASGFSRILSLSSLNFVRKPLLITIFVGGVLTVLGQGSSFFWMSNGKIVSPFLEDITMEVRKYSKPHECIMTDQPLVAHQAGRPLLHGFEGAPFTYTPFWDTEMCYRFSTVNDVILEKLLREQCASLLVLSPQAFRMASPGFIVIDDEKYNMTWKIIHLYYSEILTIEDFAGTGEKILFFIPKSKSVSREDKYDLRVNMKNSIQENTQ